MRNKTKLTLSVISTAALLIALVQSPSAAASSPKTAGAPYNPTHLAPFDSERDLASDGRPGLGQVVTTYAPLVVAKKTTVPYNVIIKNLIKGEEVSLVDGPVNGYYRAVDSYGNVGWIWYKNIRILKAPGAELMVRPIQKKIQPRPPISVQPETVYVRPSQDLLLERVRRAQSVKHRVNNWDRIYVLGGMNWVNLNEMTQRIGANWSSRPLTSGVYHGIQYSHRHGDSGLALRFEGISKNQEIVDRSTLMSYRHELSSSPLMVGYERYFNYSSSERFVTTLGVFGGIGINTQFKSNINYGPAGSDTVFSGNPFTMLLKTSTDYRVSNHFGIGAEFGYRFLKTTMDRPTVSGSGAAVFSANPAYDYSVDLSGAFAGLSLHFQF